MTDADLLPLLRDCYDPILKRNIVELGLVRSASLREDTEAPGIGVGPRYIADIVVNATSADEAAIAQLRAQVENRFAGLPEISRVHVTVVPTPFPILR